MTSNPKLDLAAASDFPQYEMADQMRKAAALAREAGHEEIAQGNEAIAEYIEGLECGLAAERKLSIRRTEQRDAALARVEELEAEIRGAENEGDRQRNRRKDAEIEAQAHKNENARLRAELERVRTLVRDVVDDSETDLTGRMVVTMPAFLKMEQALAGGKEGRDG